MSRQLQGTQWDRCDMCDRLTPLGQLRLRDGMKRCSRTRCYDVVGMKELHAKQVAMLLSTPHEEGTDRRGTYFYTESDFGDL